jgi:LacI family transcriptional regulator/LacI family repressor for deo operon, udp, cdd, tsx, nupC, and nupG
VASSRIGSNHIERLARINVPVVLVNSQAEGEHDFLHSIAVDDRIGARRAVEHLIELAHRRIAYIGVTNRPKSNSRRLRGYYDALEAASIEPDHAWIRIVDLDPALEDSDVRAGKQATTQLLDSGVSALFCYNDMVAVGALLACREADVAVPDDVSIIGFDDIELARYVHPALTTVSQPKQEMGSTAMQMVVDLLEQKPVANQIIEPVVVKRGSTKSYEGTQ